MILLVVMITSGLLLLIIALQQMKEGREEFNEKMYNLNYNNKPVGKNIDAVVTWVNTTDPTWITAYNYNTGKKFQSRTDKERWTPQTADPEAELSTCLELIRRNMPWIRKTFVVTGFQQRPKCLKDEILIDHQDLGLGPVFNSHAIESVLHKIPGLAENFIYVNDDVYVRKPVPPSVFINQNNQCLLYFNSGDSSNKWAKFLQSSTAAPLNLDNIIPEHVPYSLTLSMLQEAERALPKKWRSTEKCKLRYECEDEISPIVAAMLIGLSQGKAVKAPPGVNSRYFTGAPSENNPLVKKLHFMCINELDKDREGLRRSLQIEDEVKFYEIE